MSDGVSERLLCAWRSVPFWEAYPSVTLRVARHFASIARARTGFDPNWLERVRKREVCEMVDRKKVSKRRDATGHLNAEYERRVSESARSQRDDSSAFLSGFRTADALAEELG